MAIRVGYIGLGDDGALAGMAAPVHSTPEPQTALAARGRIAVVS